MILAIKAKTIFYKYSINLKNKSKYIKQMLENRHLIRFWILDLKRSNNICHKDLQTTSIDMES